MAGLERPVALAAADDLVRGELLRLEPLELVHPVVRAAIYESIGSHERGEAHRRAAGLLVEGGAEPERAASHLLLVPPARDPFVVSTLRTRRRACGRARRRRARPSSTCAARSPSRRPPPSAARCSASSARSSAASTCRPRSSTCGEAVQLIEEPPATATSALQYARALGYAGFDSAEAVEVYRAAIHSADGANRPTSSRSPRPS